MSRLVVLKRTDLRFSDISPITCPKHWTPGLLHNQFQNIHSMHNRSGNQNSYSMLNSSCILMHTRCMYYSSSYNRNWNHCNNYYCSGCPFFCYFILDKTISTSSNTKNPTIYLRILALKRPTLN